MIDFDKIPLNLEVKISEGKFSAVVISFNPTKKDYSWTLYFQENNELHPVRPHRMSGQVKTWEKKSDVIDNLKKYIKELK
jgi:hypothetical protein